MIYVTKMVLYALLSLYTNGRMQDEIEGTCLAEEIGTASWVHSVPVAVLVAVGMMESRLGTDPASQGNWGVGTRNPIFRAARALRSGYDLCHRWDRAATYFRWGRCVGDDRTNYGFRAISLAHRLEAQSGVYQTW